MNKMVNGSLAGLVLASGVVIPQQQVEAAQAQHTLDHVDIRIHNANFTLNSITYNPDGSIANQESETKQADVIGAHAVIINYTNGGSVQLNNFSFTNEDGGEIRAMFNNNGLGKLNFGDIASVTFVVDLQAKDGTVYNNVNVTLSGQYMHDAYDRCPGWDYVNKGLDFLIPASDNVSVTLEAYNVTVNYIDEATGQQIAQSHVDNVVEGHSYDVSDKDDEIVIDGYEYVRTEGNLTGSNMSGNEVVNVYYRQLENYSVTINYLDKETGEPIAESYLSELIREGGSYDVSHLDDEIVIDGYTFSHVEGDNLSGVMDENKVINVFYDRIPEEYTLTINYLDKETGEPLGDPHSQVIIEDEEYNVSHLDDEIEFDKYDYVETQGELEGIASGDVVIDVFYERKSVPMTPLIPATPIPYDITVRYVDEEGNELQDPFIQEDVNAGTEWDVSDKDDEVEIDGYEYVETQGETSGERLDGDKEIIVVYRELEEFDITVRYEDEEGNELQDPFVQEDVREGEEFDVTGETEVEIPGYVREEVKGDPSGVVDEDEVIVVIYRPLEEFNVIINYLDEEGNVLHEQHSQVVVEGEGYDVSDLDDEIEIDGFNYKATEGDELVDDAIDSDRVINVIYSPIPTHDITVRYEDEEGNELQDPFVQEDVREGSEFDVSDKDDEVTIPGYVYVETEGETEGVVDEDEEIVVVYRPLEEFELIINYLDKETGEPIGEPHQEVIIEGKGYDVSHLDDEIAFEKYDYVETEGEVIGEDVQGNVVINVYYERKSVPMTPLIPAQPILYDITVRYVDEEGNELVHPQVIDDVKAGSEFDVSDLDDEVLIPGYVYVETQGETSGIVDGDKEIVVVYTKVPEPVVELFDLVVRYVDIDGNELLPSYEEQDVFTPGEFVTLDFVKDIEGYNYLTGGNVIGTVTEDIEVVVIYEKVVEPEPQMFELVINYLDVMTGKPIGEAHMEGILEGQSYDVSNLDDEVEFEGYNYLATQGDVIGKDVQDNVVINVYYEKEQVEEEIPLPDTMWSVMILRVDSETGEFIGDMYLDFVWEGDSYDVSHLDDEVVIDGYVFEKVEGEVKGDNIQESKLIIVYYNKIKPEVEPQPEPEQPVVPQEPEQPQEPQPEPTPEPEKPQEKPQLQKPEAPKAEVEFDVPQTGLDASIYMGIATALAAAGFAVRIKKERK